MPPNLISEHEVEQWIAEPMSSIFVHIMEDAHHSSSPGYILHWLASSPFLDKITGTQLGGPGGIRFGLFLIIRLLVSLRRMEKDLTTPTISSEYLGINIIIAYINRCSEHLVQQITDSIVLLQSGAQEWRRGDRAHFVPHRENQPLNMQKTLQLFSAHNESAVDFYAELKQPNVNAAPSIGPSHPGAGEDVSDKNTCIGYFSVSSLENRFQNPNAVLRW
jgi:hypothetical protein